MIKILTGKDIYPVKDIYPIHAYVHLCYYYTYVDCGTAHAEECFGEMTQMSHREGT